MTDAALAANGVFRVSLSGGSTPKALYTLLASEGFREQFPWQRVAWYWGDERFVPHDHPDSNYRMTREAMLAKVPVPPENVNPVPADGTPEQALRAISGPCRRPMAPSARSDATSVRHHAPRPRRRWSYRFAAAGRAGPAGAQGMVAAVSHGRAEVRITMTYPVIESSRRVAFLVRAGKGGDLQDDPRRRQPGTAARVRPVGELIWFVDQAAAAETRGMSILVAPSCCRRTSADGRGGPHRRSARPLADQRPPVGQQDKRSRRSQICNPGFEVDNRAARE